MSDAEGHDGRRTAIVTGGGTGLGRATVEALAEAGMNCMIAGRRPEPLAATVEASVSLPGVVESVTADVDGDEGRERIVAACLDRFGRIDVLVNNAGITGWGPLLDYSEEEWRAVLTTNLDACFFLTQKVLPHMREHAWGRVVNIGSMYASLARNSAFYGDALPTETPGDRGPVRAPAYHAAKGGLLNLTRDLAVAVAKWGVTVNTVSPGPFRPMENRPVAAETLRRVTDATPLGRLGEPEEIGYAVRFLASDEAGFITGAELMVDGGWSIW